MYSQAKLKEQHFEASLKLNHTKRGWLAKIWSWLRLFKKDIGKDKTKPLCLRANYTEIWLTQQHTKERQVLQQMLANLSKYESSSATPRTLPVYRLRPAAAVWIAIGVTPCVFVPPNTDEPKSEKTEKRLGGFFRYTIDDDGNMTIKEKINLDIKK